MTRQKLLRILFLTVCLFVFVFPAVIGAGFAWVYYPERFEEAKAFLRERNKSIGVFIDGYFKELRNTVRILAAMPEVSEIPWLDGAGKARVLRLYREIQRQNPNIYYIYSGYTDGTLLINDYEPPPGYDPRVRPWYKAVMDAPVPGKEVVGLLYREAKTQELLLATVHILERPAHGFTGAVSIDSYTREISAQIERRSDIYHSARSFIVDDKGTILVHPQPEYIGRNVEEIFGENPVIRAETYFPYAEGLQRRVAYISDIPIAGWRLVTTVDEEEIRGPILRRLSLYALALMVVCLALGLILAYIWRNRVIRPLLSLSQRLRHLAGVADLPVEVRPADDEIAEITATIESLTVQALLEKNAQLARAYQEISAKNQVLSQKNDLLEKLATEDGLTGLLNRRKLEECLAEEYERFRRHGVPFSLILFDIDHFKSVNDSYGHQAGDEVLRQLSEIVARRLRATDVFGRWGGEEFMIVVRNGDLQEALTLAEQLRARVEDYPFSIGRTVTISLGVGEIRPGESVDQLISRVDDYLYRAKRNGRNRVGSEKL